MVQALRQDGGVFAPVIDSIGALIAGGVVSPATSLAAVDRSLTVNANGDGAEEVVILTAVGVLSTTAEIADALNARFAALTGASNKKVRIAYLEGRWILIGPVHATPASSTLVVTAGTTGTDISTSTYLNLRAAGEVSHTAATISALSAVYKLNENFLQRGTKAVADFAGGTTCAVVFTYPLTAATFTPIVAPGENLTWWITAKTAAGFTINLSAVPLVDVDWAIMKH